MSIICPGKKIAICSDHAGYGLKSIIEGYLESQEIAYEDFGTYGTESCDYPDYAHPAAVAVEEGRCYPGIAMCGTGNGIAMTQQASGYTGCAVLECGYRTSGPRTQRCQCACVACTVHRSCRCPCHCGCVPLHSVRRRPPRTSHRQDTRGRRIVLRICRYGIFSVVLR